MSDIPIPDDLKHIIKEIIVIRKSLFIHLGIQYPNKKVPVPISLDFTKFKNAIKKGLKRKHVDEEEIEQIISLIEDNYAVIYPDNGDDIVSSDCSVESDVKKEESQMHKPDITFEEWQSQLVQKYNAIKDTCDKNFPGMWHSLEFELSVIRILNISGCTLPFAGIILGAPSSSKTLGIELFREYKNVYYSDSFTPKAFVSHSTAVSKEELEEIDMLPKIKDKCLLVPELSSIFAKRDDEIIDTLGIFTRVLDGHGYQSDSGAHGRRGYNGNYMFTMIGAAVEVPHKVHRFLSNLGPKLYFLRMPRINKDDKEYIKMLKENNFESKKEALKEKINNYLDWFDKYCPLKQYDNNNLLKISCEERNNGSNDEDDVVIRIIVSLGKLLSNLRGTVSVWDTKNSQGSSYGYSTPILEEPGRAMTQLLNLAKGHALSQGRNYLTMEDIPLLIKVVLSTASIERVMLFDLLLAHNGTITTSELVGSLKIARPTALRTMVELKILELVSGDHFDIDEDEDYGSRLSSVHDKYSNEKKTITLNKDFDWFLSEEFQGLREGFVPDGKSRYDSKRDVDVNEKDESVKKNSPHIQQKILLEDVQSQTTSPIIQSPLAVAAAALSMSSPLPSPQQQLPMLPSPSTSSSLPLLIQPLPSLPLLTISKHNEGRREEGKESLISNNKYLDHSCNQGKVIEDNTLLVTAITATAINSSSLKNKK